MIWITARSTLVVVDSAVARTWCAWEPAATPALPAPAPTCHSPAPGSRAPAVSATCRRSGSSCWALQASENRRSSRRSWPQSICTPTTPPSVSSSSIFLCIVWMPVISHPKSTMSKICCFAHKQNRQVSVCLAIPSVSFCWEIYWSLDLPYSLIHYKIYFVFAHASNYASLTRHLKCKTMPRELCVYLQKRASGAHAPLYC